MRFAVYFLAFVLFICSWNLKQVFGKRTVYLKEYDCDESDTFCGVAVSVIAPDEVGPYKDKFQILRRVIVLRKLIEDEKKPNTISKWKPAEVLPTWTGQCLGKFCVAVIKDSNSPPILKMSYPNPRIDRDNFDMHTPGNAKDPSHAPSFSISPLMPKLSYSCNHKKKKCHISSSAYGAPPFQYTIPLSARKKDLKGFKTNFYANGISACFQSYCTFVDRKRLQVRTNFDVNHYANMNPFPLKPNSKNEIEYEKLQRTVLQTQVEIMFEKAIQGHWRYKCTYQLPRESNHIKETHLTRFVDIPDNVNDSTLKSILRFKALNGVGVCAGYACCFKDDSDKEKLYKQKVDSANLKPNLRWVKTAHHLKPLDLENAE